MFSQHDTVPSVTDNRLEQELFTFDFQTESKQLERNQNKMYESINVAKDKQGDFWEEKMNKLEDQLKHLYSQLETERTERLFYMERFIREQFLLQKEIFRLKPILMGSIDFETEQDKEMELQTVAAIHSLMQDSKGEFLNTIDTDSFEKPSEYSSVIVEGDHFSENDTHRGDPSVVYKSKSNEKYLENLRSQQENFMEEIQKNENECVIGDNNIQSSHHRYHHHHCRSHHHRHDHNHRKFLQICKAPYEQNTSFTETSLRSSETQNRHQTQRQKRLQLQLQKRLQTVAQRFQPRQPRNEIIELYRKTREEKSKSRSLSPLSVPKISSSKDFSISNAKDAYQNNTKGNEEVICMEKIDSDLIIPISSTAEQKDQPSLSYTKESHHLASPSSSSSLSSISSALESSQQAFHSGSSSFYSLPPSPLSISEDSKSNDAFSENLKRLIEFKKKYGHFRPRRTDREWGKIARWCTNARYHRNIGKLSKDRIRQLDMIGFDWDPQHAPHPDRRRS